MKLADFAATQRRKGRPCWVCHVPEREEIDATRRAFDAARSSGASHKSGVSLSTMVDWLVQECGYDPEDATEPRLLNHFRRRHHDVTTTNGTKTKSRAKAAR